MTTRGFDLIYIETHSWGKSVAFWQQLGFKLEFETDHHSGVLAAPNGTRIFLAEQSLDEPVGIDLYLGVADPQACRPEPPGGRRAPLHRQPLGHPGNDRPRSGRPPDPAGGSHRAGRSVVSMARLEEIIASLPEASRVDIAAWDGNRRFASTTRLSCSPTRRPPG